MDIATVLGLMLGAGLILLSILISPGSPFGAFIDYPSMMVVIGGSFAAVMISFPLSRVLAMGGVMKVVFLNKPPNIPDLIEQIVSLAETARRDGLLALEARIEDLDNPFVVLGIQMAVDGTQPEVIEDVMRTEMEAVSKRHREGKGLLDQAGRFAPAFGMIGTLMGLIMMLGNMQDPAAIGPGMAVALITTLYGAIVSNLIFLPCAEKLAFIHRQEALAREIIVRGIMGIQSGDNPRIIEQKLNTYVPPRARAGAQEQAA